MRNAKLVCFRSGVLLQDWITFKSLALEDRSWIMNQMAEEKYGRLLNQLVNSCTTPLILVELATLIFDKAILEPTFCPMYAKLCSDMHYKLPTFTEPGGTEITIKRLLLNLCQQMFEETENLREELRKRNAPDRKEKEIMLKLKTLGNLRLIGELLNQKMITKKICHRIVQELLGDDEKMCPPAENVEAVCIFLKTTGKEFDDGSNLISKQINDEHFRRLQNLSNHPQLVMQMRYMIRNIINLRSNRWVFRPEVVLE